MMRDNTVNTPLIYLDYAASAPLLPEARAAMETYYNQWFAGANPNAFHKAGKYAAQALEQARLELARVLMDVCTMGTQRIHPRELIFTSGGTESDHLGVIGLARAVRARDPQRTAVVISELEHHAVSELEARLTQEGFTVKTLRATDDLTIDLAHLERLLCEDKVALVSAMYAHNEVGTIQPISAAGQLAHAHGALMHTDAVQAFCHLRLDLTHVDAASFAAHKLGGPRGIGLCYLRRGVKCQPLLVGGGQEYGLRSGTQNVAGALGFAAAARAMAENLDHDIDHLLNLRIHLLSELAEAAQNYPALTYACTAEQSFLKDRELIRVNPGITHLIFSGKPFDQLIMKLDEAGIAASAGSACTSTATTSHHVPPSISRVCSQRLNGLSYTPLRISAGRTTAVNEIDALVTALTDIAQYGRVHNMVRGGHS